MSPSSLNPQIPKKLEELIHTAIAKDRSQRYHSASVLRSQLEMVRSALISPSNRQPSIAILPFRDVSPQKDQEYFSDGPAEELINALARLPG